MGGRQAGACTLCDEQRRAGLQALTTGPDVCTPGLQTAIMGVGGPLGSDVGS